MSDHADTSVRARQEFERHIARARRLRRETLGDFGRRARMWGRRLIPDAGQAPALTKAQQEQMIRTMPVF
ncbi:MAG: hypothetical protein AAGD47_14675 [Pseudomonadota bacterium]